MHFELLEDIFIEPDEKIKKLKLPEVLIYCIMEFNNDFRTNINFEVTCVSYYGRRPRLKIFYNTWQRAHSAAQDYVPYGSDFKYTNIDETSRYPLLNRYNQDSRIDLTKPQDMFIPVRYSLAQSEKSRVSRDICCLEAICSTLFSLCSILKSCCCSCPKITIQACFCCYGATTGLWDDCKRMKGVCRNQSNRSEFLQSAPSDQVMKDEKILDPVAFHHAYSYRSDSPKNYYEAISLISKNAFQASNSDFEISKMNAIVKKNNHEIGNLTSEIGEIESKNTHLGNWYIEFPLYLAQCYKNGNFVMNDPYKACFWYKLAIIRISWFKKKRTKIKNMNRELQAAYHYLATIYEKGSSRKKGNSRNRVIVPKDDRVALTYYYEAAKLGDPSAQYSLGGFYENGKATTNKNLVRARFFYEQAAKQRHSEAVHALKRLGWD